MAEVPLLKKIVDNDSPEEHTEPEGDEQEAMPTGNELVTAQGYVDQAEALAADAEVIAEKMPEASDCAKEARAAADEAAAALPGVEEAQKQFDGAIATAGSESAEAVAAQRSLEDACRIVKEAFDRALAACDEAKASMPALATGAETGEASMAHWMGRMSTGG